MNNSLKLKLFHPLIRKWFEKTLGNPTDIQQKAWPEIAKGNHVLVTAPTGSGKTLTAFLWAINQLLNKSWPNDQIRVLYVSPLKALNNDVEKNLIQPLSELETCFKDAGQDFVDIRVMTRSGDTPYSQRRQMMRHPPQILITTPESLNILVASQSGRKMLTGIATVILDEVHALIANKRGTHLITAIDRITLLSGEFQRIALSATVKPLDRVALFVGGFEIQNSLDSPIYQPRKVKVICSQTGFDARSKYAVSIKTPFNASDPVKPDSVWPVLAESFVDIIERNRSVLLFANSRRTTEKVTRLINELSRDSLRKNIDADQTTDVAYSHHGSLSKEIRLCVEQKLKKGELKAIVATNSLELGIDIGQLDRVILIQTPFTVTSAIQRIGRSGHRVDQVSQGDIFPTHGMDFVNSAVMARCILDQDIEPIDFVACPLDVLSQVLLSMTCVQTWQVDQLYAFIRSISVYHELSRRQFDLVLEMLAGRYADSRIRELKPRIYLDRIDNTVTARENMRRIIFLAGGTIPDRGYFDLRLKQTRAKIGELDEEFVWERSVGETFTLGTQIWRIQNITHNDVEVVPVAGKPGIIPFWRAEARNRDFHFSDKISAFLEYADSHLNDPQGGFETYLQDRYCMEPESARILIAFLKRQREATQTVLPHRHHILIEHFKDPFNTSDSKQVVLHTLWGGRINRPFALALAAAWEKLHGYLLQIFANDDCILLELPHRFGIDDIFDHVRSTNVEELLSEKLSQTGFFGAKFRENAGRALLLPKVNYKNRMPLWLNRLRSKKLLESVIQTQDFPIVIETFRDCLQDEFDLTQLKVLLDEVAQGIISISQAITKNPSPFAQGLVWQQTNYFMYVDDTPTGGKPSSVNADRYRQIMELSHLRPKIASKWIQNLSEKLARTAPGYCPASSSDLLEWIKERIVIRHDEWEVLIQAMARDLQIEMEQTLSAIADKVVWIAFPGATDSVICALEILPRISARFGLELEALNIKPMIQNHSDLETKIDKNLKKAKTLKDSEQDLSDLISQWLSYYSLVEKPFISQTFGLDQAMLDQILETLTRDMTVVIDLISQDATQIEVCYRENLEILLRIQRQASQPRIEPLPIDHLPLFLARFQGLTQSLETLEDLQFYLEQLFGVVLPAQAWEEYILPARMDPYFPQWLDQLMQASDLCWFGKGNQRLGFAFAEDLELFIELDKRSKSVMHLFPYPQGRFSFADMITHTGTSSKDLTEKLWQAVWQGKISNDTMAAIREGILNRFKPMDITPQRKGNIRRGNFNRWKKSRPMSGSWYAFADQEKQTDLLDQIELSKDRIRQLFKRYGILFRQLLAKELPALHWDKLIRCLRLMELSGEILSGCFFEQIPGIQFISHQAFRDLSHSLDQDCIYWLNATDPASLCGIGIDVLKAQLPARLKTTYMVFHGSRLIMVVKRDGRELLIDVPADDPNLIHYFKIFKTLTGRHFNPKISLLIEKINDVPALSSEYAKALIDYGFKKDYKGLELRRPI